MSELFDLRNDPDEQQNLYSTEPEIASRLHSFLFTEGALSISERASSGEAPNQDALNGLGYTGESEDSE